MSHSLHWAALLASLVLVVGSHLLLRIGARHSAGPVNLATTTGLAAFGLVTVLMVFALQVIELKIAIALNAFTFIGTPLAEHHVLGEPLDRRTTIGSRIVFLGVLIFLAGG